MLRPAAAVRPVLCFAMLLLPWASRAGTGGAEKVRYLRDITLAQGQQSGDDLICVYCSIRVQGTATGDVIAIGGDIEVEGSVKGDVLACGGGVTVEPGAHVEGEASAIGGKVEARAGAKVDGELDSIPYLYVPGQRGLNWISGGTFFLSNLLLALAGVLVFRPQRIRNAAASVGRHPLLAAVAGFVLLAVWFGMLWLETPNLFVRILHWTANVLLFGLFYCGCTALAGGAGALLLRGDRMAARCAAGAVLLSLAMLIPVAGAVVFVLLSALAFGASLVSGLGRDPDSLPSLFRRKSRFSKAAAHSAHGLD